MMCKMLDIEGKLKRQNYGGYGVYVGSTILNYFLHLFIFWGKKMCIPFIV
jgi:hypothetical protein